MLVDGARCGSGASPCADVTPNSAPGAAPTVAVPAAPADPSVQVRPCPSTPPEPRSARVVHCVLYFAAHLAPRVRTPPRAHPCPRFCALQEARILGAAATFPAEGGGPPPCDSLVPRVLAMVCEGDFREPCERFFIWWLVVPIVTLTVTLLVCITCTLFLGLHRLSEPPS